ncbi:hypothetical protein [Clostridium botulinum]|uniref:hypothetical protein n=1 Tax=Clostridium botulinum TaxID=1491 RepID=UPI003DA536BD
MPEEPELKVDLNKFKGRLIKIYDNINKDWIKFCKKDNQFKNVLIRSMYSIITNIKIGGNYDYTSRYSFQKTPIKLH